jgi:hypothetical protein
MGKEIIPYKHSPNKPSVCTEPFCADAWFVGGMFLFLVFLSKQVGMCAGVNHDEDEFLVMLLPNK